MKFYLFIFFIILLRLVELLYSKRNEKWLLQNGAVEYGKEHYPFIVLLSLQSLDSYSLFFVSVYFMLLAFKAWVLLSLGKFWNTKIYRIPGMPLIHHGPYKYLKHPNYFIVVAEIAVIPLAFHLYYTVIIFSILNGFMLFIRIKTENKALEI